MKVFAGANVRHASVVVLLLPLRLVHRLVGPAGDCFDDVDHATIPELLESGASCFGGGGGGGWV
jgi:hypothetical protein